MSIQVRHLVFVGSSGCETCRSPNRAAAASGHNSMAPHRDHWHGHWPGETGNAKLCYLPPMHDNIRSIALALVLNLDFKMQRCCLPMQTVFDREHVGMHTRMLVRSCFWSGQQPLWTAQKIHWRASTSTTMRRVASGRCGTSSAAAVTCC